MATKTAEAHLVQYIDRVVDVPVDEEPGDAEDARSCCKKCYSDVRKRSLIFLLMALRRLLFKHRQLKTFAESHDSGGQGSRCWTTPSTQTFRTRTPWCILRKDCGGAAGADH